MSILERNINTSVSGYTIAVIDPDKDLNLHLTNALSAVGCTVFQAFSYEDIVYVISKNPDFIIIDPAHDVYRAFDLCGYLTNPNAAGVIVYTSDIHLRQREDLFKSGVLEFFSKDEPLDTIADEFIHLLATIKDNHINHVTMIGGTDVSQQNFKQLVMHRNYQLCFLKTCSQLAEKWNDHTHELPDLLLLDCRDQEDLKEGFRLINFVRTVKLSEIPIIFTLNETDTHSVSKLYRAGVNEVLIEPFTYEKLLSKITHHLDYQINKIWLHHEQSLSNQLKAMIDSSSIVSKADPKGIITYVNDAFCSITGYTRDELIGQPHNIIRHPETYPLFFEQMWETIQKKEVFRGIIRNKRKDGSSYYVDTTISAIVDDNNTIREYLSIRHDITALIERQQEIEAQRRRIQNVLDAQTSLICMVDKTKGIVQSNRAFLDFLGIPNLNPKLRGFTNLSELFLDSEGLFHIENGQRMLCLDRLYEMRNQFVKVAMKDKFLNHHFFTIHVEKIQDNSFTKGICYLISFEDITQLNRTLNEAKACSEAESRFLATMSHEIRTPLNGILGFAELLDETSLDAQQKKYLKTIQYSGETLRQIINDILDVMKFDREELTLNLELINLTGELESILYPFYSIAHKKGVNLLVFIDPKLPTMVSVDFLRLKQILINLVSNAIKFTPGGKKVYVRIKNIKTVDDKVTIGFTVADEGIGVRPQHKANIFKPFVQADNSIAREFGGTGLGLSIVARIVNAMNAKILFKSIYGEGSVFNVTLKLTFNASTPSYECQVHTTYLYSPHEKPTARFSLIERYLHRFACCDSHVYRISSLDGLIDDPDTHLILFMEMMSTEEIHNAMRQFIRAKIFIIPSTITDTLPSDIRGDNVIYVNEELTWSTIANRLDIEHHHLLQKSIEKMAVTFEGLRILIAEDNEVNQLYIQELLNRLNIEHDLAYDGYEAIKKFMKKPYDLVLMDINMPNMDGITATQQILLYESQTGTPHTPVIGLSADAVASNITHYLTQGLDGYLVKPLRKSDLTALLYKYFSSHAVLQESAVCEPPLSVQSTKPFTAFVVSKIELPEEVVQELFKKFISNAQTILSQFHERSNDHAALRMAVHSLKGISRNLSLNALGNMCAAFETDLLTLSSDQQIQRLRELEEETLENIKTMQGELL